nr:MAG TPA: hypothetical protein [Caudoviricetes sp.]
MKYIRPQQAAMGKPTLEIMVIMVSTEIPPFLDYSIA